MVNGWVSTHPCTFAPAVRALQPAGESIGDEGVGRRTGLPSRRLVPFGDAGHVRSLVDVGTCRCAGGSPAALARLRTRFKAQSKLVPLRQRQFPRGNCRWPKPGPFVIGL